MYVCVFLIWFHSHSVGSLGVGQSYAAVEDIHVSHSTFTETMWAARIKTWKVAEVLLLGVSFT